MSLVDAQGAPVKSKQAEETFQADCAACYDRFAKAKGDFEKFVTDEMLKGTTPAVVGATITVMIRNAVLAVARRVPNPNNVALQLLDQSGMLLLRDIEKIMTNRAARPTQETAA